MSMHFINIGPSMQIEPKNGTWEKFPVEVTRKSLIKQIGLNIPPFHFWQSLTDQSSNRNLAELQFFRRNPTNNNGTFWFLNKHPACQRSPWKTRSTVRVMEIEHGPKWHKMTKDDSLIPIF